MSTQPERKIRIGGNWRKGGPETEFAGEGTVDKYGAIDCSADLGSDAYDRIEKQIAEGLTEGRITVRSEDQDRDITYHWGIS